MKHKIYKIGNFMTKAEADAIIKDIDNFFEEKKQRDVTQFSTVYFDVSSGISRKEFKENYPNIKIVRDITKAEVLIIKEKPYFWGRDYHFTGSSRWTSSQLREVNKAATIVNAADSLKGYIYDVDVKFTNNSEELPDEMVERIGSMLKSRDKETFDLGMKILFQYDHVKSLNKFYLLLAGANSYSWYGRVRSRTTEPKIKFIKSQFRNHRF